jgi:hypothetical protein
MQNKPNANAPNKPNLGPGKMKGKCCANKELRQVGCGSGPEKTKPIRSGGGYQGQGSAARAPAPELRASCTNKPNSDRGHVRGKSCRGKDLWCIIHAEDFGETKPIHAPANRDGRWPAGPEAVRHQGQSCDIASMPRFGKQTQFLDCGFRIADWERTCCGMPGLRPAASGLRGVVVQTKPIGRSQSCDNASLPGVVPATNPICPDAPANGRGWPGTETAKCAKQTQSAADGQLCQTRRARQKSASTEPIRDIGPETRVETRLGDFCRGRQTNPIWPVGRSQSCETNPIRPGLGRARLWVDERCETNPICRMRRRGGPDRSCETKPICSAPVGKGGAAKAASVAAGAKRAKRSQFPGIEPKRWMWNPPP